MGNLKARFKNVQKATEDVIFNLPHEFPSSAIPKFISEEELEIKRLLNLPGLQTSPSLSFYLFQIQNLIKSLDKTKLEKSSKLKQCLLVLANELEIFFKCYNKPQRSKTGSKPDLDLSKKPTKQLKKELNDLRSQRSDDYEDILLEKTRLKAELCTREHVPSSAQSKLIRKMSIHSGRKLTLREAQILNNQLNKKPKN